jgi:intergrase/recombinase
VKEIYISDKELLIAYKNISERFRPLFKLLVYSGVRLTQALGGIKYLANAITKGDVCRIPVNSVSRGNKKVYWIYFPSSFLDELRGFDTHFNPYTYQKGIKFNRVSASAVRKWHLNFLIEQSIPESVCDFVQGRASVTVGSAHYLAKTQQADVWYAKAVPKLLRIFSSED